MSIVMLRTADDRYWRAADRTIVLSPEADALSWFSIEPLESEEIALRSILGDYVTVADSSNAPMLGEAGARTRLRMLDREEGTQVLQTADGREVLVEGQAAFTITPVELPEGGCCGPTAPLEVSRWNRFWGNRGHRLIFDEAVDLLRGDHVKTMPNVRLFLERFYADGNFSDGLIHGLRDADYKLPYCGPSLGSNNLFGYHFCDPATMKTLPFFTEPLSPCNAALLALIAASGSVAMVTVAVFVSRLNEWPRGNAISEGLRYYHVALHDARRILRLGQQAGLLRYFCGYNLGLSLHFLTDLTQPMHTASFANVLGFPSECASLTDMRHEEYELYAEQRIAAAFATQSSQPLAKTDLNDAALDAVGNIGSLFLTVARRSKEIFDTKLRTTVEARLRNSSRWGEDAHPSIDESMKTAARNVALFLTHWTRETRLDPELDFGLSRDSWFRIVEPTKGELLSEGAGGKIERQAGETQNTRVFLQWNADGTCSFGTRGAKGKGRFWRIDNQTLVASDSDHADGHLRVLPTAEHSVWFFSNQRIAPDVESTFHGDQALTIEGAHVMQKIPGLGPVRPAGDTETQIFNVTATQPLTDDDRAMIRKARPNMPGDLPWWGIGNGWFRWFDWQKDTTPIHRGASLAATSRRSGTLDLFLLADRDLWHREYFGTWGDWTKIERPASFPPLDGPMAVTFETHFDVFAATRDGSRLFHATSSAGSQWTWEEVPHPKPVRSLAALYADRLEVYAVFDDGDLLKTERLPSGKWAGWTQLRAPSGIVPVGVGVATTKWAGGVRHAVTVGRDDGRIRQIWSDTRGEWHWQELENPLPAGVTAVSIMATSSAANQLDILLYGSDQRLRRLTWTGAWSKWETVEEALSGAAPFGVAAASWGRTHLDVFAGVNEPHTLATHVWQRTHQ